MSSKSFVDYNQDVIVDIKVSNTRESDAELMRQGYSLIMPDIKNNNMKSSEAISVGTFGRGQSLWIWRRKQGTCSGRLKPIIDIQLENTSSSSAMVLSGFTCLEIPISGQYVWIRRASNVQEEEDSIVDINATIGKSKIPTDKIWNSPGVGWNRVDGNFGKGMLSSFDAFIWYLPLKVRANDKILVSPLRSALMLSDEVRKSKLRESVRKAFRHFVPLNDMKRLAKINLELNEDEKDANDNLISSKIFDFGALYSEVIKLL